MFKGLGALGNLASLMQQAQGMQQRMADVQAELARTRVEGQAGGGMVTVEATGQQRIVAVRIDPTLVSAGDRELLEELVAGAVNQALDKARETTARKMAELTEGLPLPGLGEALSKFGLGNGA